MKSWFHISSHLIPKINDHYTFKIIIFLGKYVTRYPQAYSKVKKLSMTRQKIINNICDSKIFTTNTKEKYQPESTLLPTNQDLWPSSSNTISSWILLKPSVNIYSATVPV